MTFLSVGNKARIKRRRSKDVAEPSCIYVVRGVPKIKQRDYRSIKHVLKLISL